MTLPKLDNCVILVRQLTQKEKESGVPPERFGGTDTGQADLESLDPVSKKKGSPGLGLDCLGLSM